MKKLIVIPTYNENENIKELLPLLFDEIFNNDNTIFILIVDDNSPDNTADTVVKLQEKYKNLYLIKRNCKLGLASAYIEGFNFAKEKSFDTVIQLDADMQHPIELIPKMLNNLEANDVIIASRYTDGGKWETEVSLSQNCISVIGNKILKHIINCPIKDLTGGFNIWNKKSINTIDFNSFKSRGYFFQVELKYQAYLKNLKILEYPITFKQRKHGKSKMNIKILAEALFLLFRLKKNK